MLQIVKQKGFWLKVWPPPSPAPPPWTLTHSHTLSGHQKDSTLLHNVVSTPAGRESCRRLGRPDTSLWHFKGFESTSCQMLHQRRKDRGDEGGGEEEEEDRVERKQRRHKRLWGKKGEERGEKVRRKEEEEEEEEEEREQQAGRDLIT